MKWGATGLVVLLLAGCTSSGNAGDDEQLNRYVAIQACEGSVKKQLKAPSTADFVEEHARKSGPTRYEITGAVDSENSFGAKLRSAWFGTATSRDGGETWRCLATLLEE